MGTLRQFDKRFDNYDKYYILEQVIIFENGLMVAEVGPEVYNHADTHLGLEFLTSEDGVSRISRTEVTEQHRIFGNTKISDLGSSDFRHHILGSSAFNPLSVL